MKISSVLLFLLMVSAVSAQEHFDVFFDSNKHLLTPKEKTRVDQWIAENPKAKIVGIHGYTDEDGTSTHNDTLSQRRVETIYQMVKGKIALRDDFKTRSFGEQHNQSADKAKNRKATIYYLLEADIPRENEILGIKPMPVAKKEPVVDFPEKIKVDNPDGTVTVYSLNREFMTQLAKTGSGEKIAIPDLNFTINTFAIVPDSRGKLYELLLVLMKNPEMGIEIQGHLCCAKSDPRDLSTQRAKAIQQFLVKQGIDKSRISYKGFGVSEPKFPIPEQDETQRAANRRVEILVR